MKHILFALLVLSSLSTHPVLADSLSESKSSSVEVKEKSPEPKIEAPEESPVDDLYSSPANDPNLQSEENEGRLHGRGFSPVDSEIKQILDYSGTSERYPSSPE